MGPERATHNGVEAKVGAAIAGTAAAVALAPAAPAALKPSGVPNKKRDALSSARPHAARSPAEVADPAAPEATAE